jgi:hypothetical protein
MQRWQKDGGDSDLMTEHWKYMGLLLSAYAGDSIGQLNDLGMDGWELVAVADGIAYMKLRGE